MSSSPPRASVSLLSAVAVTAAAVIAPVRELAPGVGERIKVCCEGATRNSSHYELVYVYVCMYSNPTQPNVDVESEYPHNPLVPKLTLASLSCRAAPRRR